MILLQVISYALMIYLVLPIAESGLRVGLRMVRVELLEDGRLKIFASWWPSAAGFLVATIIALLTTGLWNIHTGRGFHWILDLLVVFAVGLAVYFFMTFLLIWIMFRLRFLEAVVGWLFSTIFTCLGSLLANFIMILITLPISWVASVVGYSYDPVAAVSARVPSVAEPAPPLPAEPHVRLRPQFGRQELPQRQYQPQPQYEPQALYIPPVNTPAVPPPAPSTPAPFMPAPAPSVALPNIHSNSQPVSPPVPPPQRKPEFLAKFEAQKSPLVGQVTVFDAGGPVRQILHSPTPSPFFAFIRDGTNGLDTVEVWNVLTHQKRGETSFIHAAGIDSHIVLSAGASHIARIIRFPTLSLDVTSFNGEAKVTVPLNERLGSPMIVGFLSSTRLAIHWTRGGQDGMEVWDLPTAHPVKQLPVMHTLSAEFDGAISPDGQYYVITVNPPRAKPQAQVYELLSTRGGARWAALNVDPSLVETPSAMAFSPDEKKFAVLFERNNNASLMCWNLADGKLARPKEFSLPIRSQRMNRRGLNYLTSANAWLVMGDLVVDSETGVIKGAIGPPEFAEQWIIDGNSLAYRFESDLHSQLALVSLSAQPAGHSDR